MDKSTDIWMYNRRTGRWTDEWMDRWTDGQINGAPYFQWPHFLVNRMMLLGYIRRAEWQRHRLGPSMGHGNNRAGGGRWGPGLFPATILWGTLNPKCLGPVTPFGGVSWSVDCDFDGRVHATHLGGEGGDKWGGGAPALLKHEGTPYFLLEEVASQCWPLFFWGLGCKSHFPSGNARQVCRVQGDVSTWWPRVELQAAYTAVLASSNPAWAQALRAQCSELKPISGSHTPSSASSPTPGCPEVSDFAGRWGILGESLKGTPFKRVLLGVLWKFLLPSWGAPKALHVCVG